jgi:hypothetical protein
MSVPERCLYCNKNAFTYFHTDKDGTEHYHCRNCGLDNLSPNTKPKEKEEKDAN